MRVCLLHIVDSPCQFGGVEKVVLMLAREFAKDKDITLAAAVNPGVLSEKLSAFGVKVYAMPEKKALNVPSFFLNLLKIIKDFRPDVIHSHHRYATMLTHFLTRRNFKLAHTFHVEQFTKKWSRLFGDAATAVSKGCKEHFVKFFGLNKDFITVIYNGVEIDHNKSHAIKRRNGESVISVVGRLTEQKGHIVFIKAISLLPPDVKNKLRVYFVGDGDKRQKLVNAVKEACLEECIYFTGRVEDVSSYIYESDFTVLPSLWEGFGLVVLESYLCGKPVIGSRVGGIPELVEHGKSGFLVEPNNPEQLKEAVLYFLNHPEFVNEAGKAGNKLALEEFTVKKMAENYKNFYARLLSNL